MLSNEKKANNCYSDDTRTRGVDRKLDKVYVADKKRLAYCLA